MADDIGRKGSVGRPRQLPEGSKKLDMRVSPDLYEALREYAYKHRWAVSTAARHILEDALLKKKRPL